MKSEHAESTPPLDDDGTEKAARYKEKYPEASKRRLHIPRDKEGEPNPEVFEVARTLEKKLAEYPFFIGLAPYGSRMKGYSSESSDVDIVIFYDSSKTPEEDWQEVFDDFKQNADQTAAPLAAKAEQEINFNYHDLSPRRIKQYLVTANPSEYLATMALGDFCEIAVGPKVEEYRKSIGDELKKQPEEKRKQAIEGIVAMLMAREKTKMEGSVSRRIPEVVGQEQEILEAREKLWQERVEKVLGLAE